MKILLALLLILPIGIINAQSTHCPPLSEQLCFGGNYYPINIYSEVQIFFDSPDPYKLTQCTVAFVTTTYTIPVTVLKIKEKKYRYKVTATLDHPKFAHIKRFIFYFSKS